jgi:methionyl-tRNA formyltransferase
MDSSAVASRPHYIIAMSRRAYPAFGSQIEYLLGSNLTIIESKSELTIERLQALRPRMIFFPHWSYIIPAEIFEQFECVIFHMTDVPFGRGGSPLQNLISRGIYETKISALRCVKELDAGPVYMKRPLSLYGTAEEIYIRAAQQIELMIGEIIQEEPIAQAQTGTITAFQRRKPNDSNIIQLETLEQVFDYIRMLDANGYPHAFIETEHLRFEFSRASIQPNEILADVRITRK